jgi:hypothetical protein
MVEHQTLFESTISHFFYGFIGLNISFELLEAARYRGHVERDWKPEVKEVESTEQERIFKNVAATSGDSFFEKN